MRVSGSYEDIDLERVVDGSLDGIYSQRSCSGLGLSSDGELWWAVHLSERYNIDHVKVTNTEDAVHGRQVYFSSMLNVTRIMIHRTVDRRDRGHSPRVHPSFVFLKRNSMTLAPSTSRISKGLGGSKNPIQGNLIKIDIELTQPVVLIYARKRHLLAVIME